jgi:3-phosphoshikimate 1-carboxyvinyltransferase
MADYIAIPPAREVRGTVAAPPSKSSTNRALILAALSETVVEIERPLDSEDTRALARCLKAMGATIDPSPLGLRVHGPLAGPADVEVTLDAGESGTAARFLAALAAATPGRFLLTGSERLRERPIGELVRALRSSGARIDYAGEAERLPVAIAGGSLRSGRVTVDASRSSQFFSALLLAGPALPGGLEVSSESGIASAPYVATTLECVRAFGHDVSGTPPALASGDSAAGPIRVTRGRGPVTRYRVPGDYSSALPLLACAGMAGGSVTITGLAWPSGDADAGALAVLERMGLEIEASAEAITARCNRGALRPVTVIATDFPDAVPVLAALASRAPGEPLRRDRAPAFEGRATGSRRSPAVRGGRCGSRGPGRQPVGRGRPIRRRRRRAKLPTFGDHRIAMAAALLSS